jgi:hypothetical protein
VTKSNRRGYQDQSRISSGTWAEGLIHRLNQGLALRYGPSTFKPPETAEEPSGLHATKGWGPPYVKRGKRSNS